MHWAYIFDKVNVLKIDCLMETLNLLHNYCELKLAYSQYRDNKIIG